MAKTLLFAFVVALSTTAMAHAQDTTPTETGRSSIRSGNITSTGETVPNPGASQGAGTTDLDRGIQREDTRIQSGICKGC